MGLLGSGILLAEVGFSPTAKVRLRKLEDEAFPGAEWADLVKIERFAALEVEQSQRDFCFATFARARKNQGRPSLSSRNM
jgi:hypothetical protein